VYQTH